MQPTSSTAVPRAKVARLVEESSLGTPGARQLRSRAAPGIADIIRARAYFSGSDTGRAWWRANQYNPDELRRKAGELAATGELELSTLLACVADYREKNLGSLRSLRAANPLSRCRLVRQLASCSGPHC